MTSLEFSVVIFPGQKSILEHIPESNFKVQRLVLSPIPDNVFLTEIYEGDRKLFLPWKLKLTALDKLIGTTLKSGVQYRLVFKNEKREQVTFTAKIIGQYV